MLPVIMACLLLTALLHGCSGPPQAAARLGEAVSEVEAQDVTALLRQLRESRRCDAQAEAPVREALEDNAPRESERRGDKLIASKVAKVLPGASEEHQHGRLGLLPDGSCCRLQAVPLPAEGLSHEEVVDSHRGFCFSSRGSEATDVDRVQADVRSEACRARHDSYPCVLPRASVIMVFHNEHLHTLLRSVHSVLNLSPADLLLEVILVDDSSEVDPDRFSERHWKRLQNELEEHVVALPKVQLLRLKERRGLMKARMEGIWRAAGEVVICLDSHIEVTPGWIEPLLVRVQEDRTRLVVPSIDGIDTEDFHYTVFGLGLVSFNWLLNQKPRERPDGEDTLAPSSVMCGGLFAADRAWFLHLGGYDPEMKIYGGEEMEIGFSAWQCGGSVVHEPCSHVGHVWRSHRYWHDQVYKVDNGDVTRNRLRVAEVWMDEYKALVHLAGPALKRGSLGDVRSRKALRARLGCKSFDWFLDNVAKEIFAPKTSPVGAGGGRLRSVNGQACVDSMLKDMLGMTVGAAPCGNDAGVSDEGFGQEVNIEADGSVRLPLTGFCLGPAKDCPSGDSESSWGEEESVPCAEKVVLSRCSGGPEGHTPPRWRWSMPVEQRKGIGRLLLEGTDKCLELVNNNFMTFGVKITSCRSEFAESQLWLWDSPADVKQEEL